jgi:hypothetical protein
MQHTTSTMLSSHFTPLMRGAYDRNSILLMNY